MALSPWVRPIAYCERDRFAQAVLLSRMRDGSIATAPIWDDVSTLSSEVLPRGIDIIYGGFPCQDISVAGNGAGLDGERSGLFFEICRLVSDIRPRFIFLENVPAISIRGLNRVLMELALLRYDCRWTIVSAAEVGACHLRQRWWLLGHSNGIDRQLQKPEHTHAGGFQLRTEQIQLGGVCDSPKPSWDGNSWGTSRPSEGFLKPGVGRAGNGLPNRMERNRGLGNAVVPIQAREAFVRLIGIKRWK